MQKPGLERVVEPGRDDLPLENETLNDQQEPEEAPGEPAPETPSRNEPAERCSGRQTDEGRHEQRLVPVVPRQY
jgi:hypothetical protein